jgi:hypothetical protein
MNLGVGFANQFQNPVGYQQISAATLASSAGLTPPATATMALISVDTANVRWRDDGTAPTAAIGMQLAAGQTFQYFGNLSAIKFILVAGLPVLNVSYYA